MPTNLFLDPNFSFFFEFIEFIAIKNKRYTLLLFLSLIVEYLLLYSYFWVYFFNNN
jgi:hypothetical protein